MTALDPVGGVPAVMRELHSVGMLHGTPLTVSGYTVEENLERDLEACPNLPPPSPLALPLPHAAALMAVLCSPRPGKPRLAKSRANRMCYFRS